MTLWSNEWAAPEADDLSSGRESRSGESRKPEVVRASATTLWSNGWQPPKTDDLTPARAPGEPEPRKASGRREVRPARPIAAAAGAGEADPASRLFGDHYPPTGPNAVQAFLERTGFSLVAHVIFVTVIVAFMRFAPVGAMLSKPMDSFPLHDIIFLDQPGPGGGGGGGGNRMNLPAKQAELAAEVKKPEPQIIPQPRPEEAPPPPPVDAPMKTSFEAVLTVPGALDGLASSLAQGPGSGGGSGTGTGTGIGPGTGSGIGPGWGGGFGGGAYRPGSGIESPLVLREVKPEYTADAMRAKIQGVVVMECVVLPDGSVGDVRITKSLDPVFGLDQKAVAAAKQWKFIPGKRQGQPVAVLVLIELTFTLR